MLWWPTCIKLFLFLLHNYHCTTFMKCKYQTYSPMKVSSSLNGVVTHRCRSLLLKDSLSVRELPLPLPLPCSSQASAPNPAQAPIEVPAQVPTPANCLLNARIKDCTSISCDFYEGCFLACLLFCFIFIYCL